MAASILKKAGKYLQNLGESVLSKQLEKQEGVADKNDEFGLQRFVTAQNTWNSYDVAVKELAAGRKRSHWIWFVLPQMRGLGHSYKSNYYGISCGHEAEAYLAHEVLESGCATCVPCSWSRPTSTSRRVRCSEALTHRRRSRRSPSSTRCRPTTSLPNVLTGGSTASATNARSCSYRQRLTMANPFELNGFILMISF